MEDIKKSLEPITAPLRKVLSPTVVKILSLLVGLGLLICVIAEFVGIILVLSITQVDWMSVVSIIFSIGYIICYLAGGVSALLTACHLRKPKRDRICATVFLISMVCAVLLYGTETVLSLATNASIRQVDKHYDAMDPSVQEQVSKSAVYAVAIITAIIWIMCNICCLCCYFYVATCNIMSVRKVDDDEEGRTYRVLEEDPGEESDAVHIEGVMKDDTELPEFGQESESTESVPARVQREREDTSEMDEERMKKELFSEVSPSEKKKEEDEVVEDFEEQDRVGLLGGTNEDLEEEREEDEVESNL